MQEESLYLDKGSSKKIYVVKHIPEEPSSHGIIFLNPLLDEKKRVQKFQAETARALCKKGITVFRFDYFGSGDSFGEIYELALDGIMGDIDTVYNEILKLGYIKNVGLLGIRFGADFALWYVSNNNNNNINNLILIEPLVTGKKFLLDQKIRRKAFYSLNKIKDVEENIIVEGVQCLDYQGYTYSCEFVDNISRYDGIKLMNITGKKIVLIKLTNFGSEKKINELREHVSKLQFVKLKFPDFWSTLEPVDTTILSKRIADISL